MNKDVIYIDVDDDVTAIIGKIKTAKEKVVALVPPKRSGALQSAVNLRLLDRMAHSSKKKLVLITSNPALVALAANASIPVAKNLQSKPEIASIPALAVDDGDDIIDGGDLPIGEHASTVPVRDGNRDAMRSEAIESIDIDGVKMSTSSKSTKKAGGSKSQVKVPNFDSFRKKLFLGIAAGVGLTALLIWMFVFAPAATVIVTARTTTAPVSAAVTLSTDQPTNYEEGIVAAVREDVEVDESIEFTATGTGLVGDEATGSVTFSNCDSSDPITVPSGTTITSNGRSYVTQASATAGAASFGGGSCQTAGSSGAVGVVATNVGSAFNRPGGTQLSVSGYSSAMRAIATSDGITGGNSEEVQVPTNADIERARGELIGRSTDERKQELIASLGDGVKVIDSSFVVSREDAVSSPAAGDEASDGTATLTITTTYSMHAVSQEALDEFLTSSIEAQLLDNTQRVYDNGADEAGISNFQTNDDTLTASIIATGRIGPQVDEAALKEQVKGKIFGEVQDSLEAIDGIREVDVQFSYFWVRTVPNDTSKIEIEFKLEDE
jgi:hypothetical protein